MKYGFYKKEISTTQNTFYMVNAEKGYEILEYFMFLKSNTKDARKLIEGTLLTKTTSEEFEYQLDDDLYIICNEEGVLIFDLTPMKLGQKEIEKESLKLTHDEFILFMSDFKNYIDKNI